MEIFTKIKEELPVTWNEPLADKTVFDWVVRILTENGWDDATVSIIDHTEYDDAVKLIGDNLNVVDVFSRPLKRPTTIGLMFNTIYDSEHIVYMAQRNGTGKWKVVRNRDKVGGFRKA